MARYVPRLTPVRAGQLGLFVAFIALGCLRTPCGMAMTTCLGWKPGTPNPNWEHVPYSVGLPIPWAFADHTTNEARVIDTWTWTMVNPFVVAAAFLIAVTAPAAAGCWARDRRAPALGWYLTGVLTGAGGLATAGFDTIAAQRIWPAGVVRSVTSLFTSQPINLWPSWGGKIARLDWGPPLLAPDNVGRYLLLTAGGMLAGALLGLLWFRPKDLDTPTSPSPLTPGTAPPAA